MLNFEDLRRHYRRAPRYRRRHAHAKWQFWMAWAASSILLWMITLAFIPVPPVGAKIDYAEFFGLPPLSPNGRQAAAWLGFGGVAR